MLSSNGDETTPYGFASEWTDAYSEMLYLRARWYAPYLNQFIQRDPIVSDYRNPQSLNAYSYVRNNPINLTDPAGLSPQDCILDLTCVDTTPNHRDLTLWLFHELSTNAWSEYVLQIHTFLASNNPDKVYRGYAAWYKLVQDRAKWDFKHEIWKELREKAFVLFHGPNRNDFRWYEYSVAGNIHYGYVGRAAGFPGYMLHLGASWAEIRDPAHVDRGEACCVCPPNVDLSICMELGCFYINPDWSSKMFDDPQDWTAVEAGVQMYNTYGRFLTYQGYQEILRLYGPWLAHPTENIEWGWINQQGTWPYEVGSFNGPDENINEPTIREILFK